MCSLFCSYDKLILELFGSKDVFSPLSSQIWAYMTSEHKPSKPQNFSSSPCDTYCCVCPAHCTDFISVSDWLDKTFSVVLSNKKKRLLDLRGLKLSLMLLQLNLSGFMSWAAEVRNKGCRSAITKSGNVHIHISSSCSQWAWNMVIPLLHTKLHVPLLRPLLQQTEVTNLKENLRTQRQEREKTGWTEIIYKHWAHKSHINKNELISLCFLLGFVTFRSSTCNSFNIHEMLIWWLVVLLFSFNIQDSRCLFSYTPPNTSGYAEQWNSHFAGSSHTTK